MEAGRTLEALRRKNLEGKKTFIEELRRQKNTKSVSLLLEILCDESWYLREQALAALVEHGDLAVEPLRGVLGSGLWYTRSAAARALGRLGDAASAPQILRLLDDTNRTVREAGLQAVQELCRQGLTREVARSMAAMPPETRSERQILLQRGDPDLAAAIENGVNAFLRGEDPGSDGALPWPSINGRATPPATKEDPDAGGGRSPGGD